MSKQSLKKLAFLNRNNYENRLLRNVAKESATVNQWDAVECSNFQSSCNCSKINWKKNMLNQFMKSVIFKLQQAARCAYSCQTDEHPCGSNAEA